MSASVICVYPWATSHILNSGNAFLSLVAISSTTCLRLIANPTFFPCAKYPHILSKQISVFPAPVLA